MSYRVAFVSSLEQVTSTYREYIYSYSNTDNTASDWCSKMKTRLEVRYAEILAMKISCQIRRGKIGNGWHGIMKTCIMVTQEPEKWLISVVIFIKFLTILSSNSANINFYQLSLGSGNGLSPDWCQATTGAKADPFSIGTLGATLSEILIEIHAFSFKKMHLKMSGKWWSFCLGLNVLTQCFLSFQVHFSSIATYQITSYLCKKP